MFESVGWCSRPGMYIRKGFMNTEGVGNGRCASAILWYAQNSVRRLYANEIMNIPMTLI